MRQQYFSKKRHSINTIRVLSQRLRNRPVEELQHVRLRSRVLRPVQIRPAVWIQVADELDEIRREIRFFGLKAKSLKGTVLYNSTSRTYSYPVGLYQHINRTSNDYDRSLRIGDGGPTGRAAMRWQFEGISELEFSNHPSLPSRRVTPGTRVNVLLCQAKATEVLGFTNKEIIQKSCVGYRRVVGLHVNAFGDYFLGDDPQLGGVRRMMERFSELFVYAFSALEECLSAKISSLAHVLSAFVMRATGSSIPCWTACSTSYRVRCGSARYAPLKNCPSEDRKWSRVSRRRSLRLKVVGI
jgi:hypothetical protein